MLLSQIAAPAEEQAGGSGLLTFLLPVALLLVFWLVLIRPQRKRQREVAEMQRNVEPGQRVMTGAGMVGTVTGVDGDEVLLEIAPGVEARFVKQAIVRNLDPATDASESEADEKDHNPSATSGDDNSDDSLPVTHDDGRKKNS